MRRVMLLPLALAACAEPRSQPATICADADERQQVRAVMTDALDQALRAHTAHMFEVWMKDPRGQPARARAGMEQGVTAYLQAYRVVMQWVPPAC